MIFCIKNINIQKEGAYWGSRLYSYSDEVESRMCLEYPDNFIRVAGWDASWERLSAYLFMSAHRHYEGWCSRIDSTHYQTPEGFVDPPQGVHSHEILFVRSSQGTQLMKQHEDFEFIDGVVEFKKTIPVTDKVFLVWQECAIFREKNKCQGQLGGNQ